MPRFRYLHKTDKLEAPAEAGAAERQFGFSQVCRTPATPAPFGARAG